MNTGENTGQFQPGADARRGVGVKGKSGRPKDIVRQACALAFDKRIPLLAKIADGKIEGASVGDRLKAIDTLGKYAGLQQIEHEHVRKPYREAVDEMLRQQAGLRLVG